MITLTGKSAGHHVIVYHIITYWYQLSLPVQSPCSCDKRWKGEQKTEKQVPWWKAKWQGHASFLPSSVCCCVCWQYHSAVIVALLWQPLVKNCIDGTERVAGSEGGHRTNWVLISLFNFRNLVVKIIVIELNMLQYNFYIINSYKF